MESKEDNIYVPKSKRGICTLTREDFDGGPVSLDEIEENIWLGNVTAATDLSVLKLHNITAILTVDSCPLPHSITEISTLTTKFVQLTDVPKEDLLSSLDECLRFVEDAVNGNKSILIHCYFGVSRSASVVIAFIMKKYNLSYSVAFERVKNKRRFVGPNPGFINQLKIFYKMDYKVDVNNQKYKQFRLKLAGDRISKAKILPQSFMDLIKSDPFIISSNPEPIVYRCKKCRRIVATKSNLICHKRFGIEKSSTNVDFVSEMEQLADKLKSSSTNSEENSTKILSSSSEEKDEICKQMYFVEPIAWMKDITNSTQGRLNCPKCTSKLGNYSWIMGCLCPCGAQVSPAFYLVPSKVEYSTVRQNVQQTV